VFKSVGDDTVSFIGQTGKATTRISKEGIVKVIKDPNVLGVIKIKAPSESATKVFLGGSIKKTPLSQTFAQKLTPVEQQTFQKLTGGLTTRAEQFVVEEISKAPVLTTQKAATSGLVTRFPSQTKQVFSNLGVQETRLRTGTGLSQVSIPKATQAEKVKSLQKIRTRTMQKQQQKQIPVLVQPLKTGQTIKQAQKVIPRTVFDQRVVQKARLTPYFKISPTPPPTKPPVIIPKLFKGKSTSIKPRGLFGVEVRRRGKFRPVAKAVPLRQAITIGREITTRGLGATFRLKPIRKTPGEIRTPRGFRRGKKPLTFIQKRKYRLGTVGEITEIQRAKRRKKKKR